MAEKLRIGIIGCGGIANGKHMPSLKKIKEVEMVAFCDIIEEKAVKAAKDFGTPDAKHYTDYKELLADKSIDVVHVCTPNRSPQLHHRGRTRGRKARNVREAHGD